MKLSVFLVGVVLLSTVWLGSCTSGGGGTDSNTNFFDTCSADGECGTGLRCLCGRCSLSCASDAACGEVAPAACRQPEPATCGEQLAVRRCAPTCRLDVDCTSITPDLVCRDRVCGPRASGLPDAGPVEAGQGGSAGDASPGFESGSGGRDAGGAGNVLFTEPPPPSGDTEIRTIATGVDATQISVQGDAVYLGTLDGKILRFDLVTAALTTLVEGLTRIDALAVTPRFVTFIAPPSAGAGATLHVLEKGKPGVSDSGYEGLPPLVADDAHAFMRRDPGMFVWGLTATDRPPPSLLPSPIDGLGSAYAVLPTALFQLTACTEVWRSDTALLGVTLSLPLSHAVAPDCGGLASHGTRVYSSNGWLMEWDDSTGLVRQLESSGLRWSSPRSARSPCG